MNMALVIVSQYDQVFDLRIERGHSDLYLWSSDFVSYFFLLSERILAGDQSNLHFLVQ